MTSPYCLAWTRLSWPLPNPTATPIDAPTSHDCLRSHDQTSQYLTADPRQAQPTLTAMSVDRLSS